MPRLGRGLIWRHDWKTRSVGIDASGVFQEAIGLWVLSWKRTRLPLTEVSKATIWSGWEWQTAGSNATSEYRPGEALWSLWVDLGLDFTDGSYLTLRLPKVYSSWEAKRPDVEESFVSSLAEGLEHFVYQVERKQFGV